MRFLQNINQSFKALLRFFCQNFGLYIQSQESNMLYVWIVHKKNMYQKIFSTFTYKCNGIVAKNNLG